MKRIAISIAIMTVLAALAALSSCNQNAASKPSEVDYAIAENYFIKNDAQLPESHKITDQETFNQIFGMATTMGDNGKPTEIDFEKEFVIAVETGLVQKETELIPDYLINHYDGKLVFHYTVKQGADISYTIRPVLIIIVNKVYEDLDIELVKH